MPITPDVIGLLVVICLMYGANYAITKQFGFPLLVETLVNKMFEVKK